MKATTLAIAALCVGTAVAAAGPYRDDQPTLNPKELHTYFAPYVPAVRDCYRENARGRGVKGELRIELLIHRDGSVVSFGFHAPGVSDAWLRRLDACLRPLSDTWHFPPRRGFTTAEIPLQFQRLAR
jgi:hypothetical protein